MIFFSYMLCCQFFVMYSPMAASFCMFFLIVPFSFAQLQLYRAGVITSAVKQLPKVSTICPSDFPNGFTIRCLAHDGDKTAKFFVNSIFVRAENVVPFFLSGDENGNAAPWKFRPAKIANVECHLPSGMYTSKVTFTCKNTSPPPSPPKPPRAAFGEHGSKPLREAGNGCIVISAKRTKLSTGWIRRWDGVEFNTGQRSHKITAPGFSTLHYNVNPSVSSRYAVVVDMTTRHGTEFNDVWLRFNTGGFKLVKDKWHTRTAGSWVKAYHNYNRRALYSSSIDFDPHAITTAQVLLKGRSYELVVSGRSNMVIVHRIILFPCSHFGCERSQTWNEALDICAQ